MTLHTGSCHQQQIAPQNVHILKINFTFQHTIYTPVDTLHPHVQSAAGDMGAGGTERSQQRSNQDTLLEPDTTYVLYQQHIKIWIKQ